VAKITVVNNTGAGQATATLELPEGGIGALGLKQAALKAVGLSVAFSDRYTLEVQDPDGKLTRKISDGCTIYILIKRGREDFTSDVVHKIAMDLAKR